MTKSEQTQATEEEAQVSIEAAVEELEVIIPAQYAKLDRLNNAYRSAREESKALLLDSYWEEGLNYREMLLFALGILRKHHSQEDLGTAAKIEEDMGEHGFETLTEARKYRNLVLELLHNYQERSESLDDEIEASKLLSTI